MKLLNRRTTGLAAIGVLLCLLAGCSAGSAAKKTQHAAVTPPKSLVSSGTLTYGVAATFPPFESKGAGGAVQGSDIDMIGALSKSMGLRPKSMDMDFDGLIPALSSRRVDIINSAMYITPERAKQVDFIPYMIIGEGMLTPTGNPRHIKRIPQDLSGRTIAVTRGAIGETYMNAYNVQLKKQGMRPMTIMSLPNNQDAMLAVRSGRADGFDTSTPGAAATLAHGGSGLSLAATFKNETKIGIAVRKGDKDTAAAVVRAMNRFVDSGQYKALLAKYHMPATSNYFAAHRSAQSTVSDSGGAHHASFLHKVFSTTFLSASLLTLELTVLSMLLGVAGGTLLALGKAAPFRPVRWLIDGYIWLFRGTPVLLQLIFVFNVLPIWGLKFSPFTCAVIALSLNEIAYMAEIVRGGLLGVDSGQRTAARMLGLSERKILRWVVLPQATRLVLPPTGNQFIGMLKTSALASVISVQDLMLTAQRQAAADFDYVGSLTAAAVHYLVLTTVFTLVIRQFERRLDVTKRAAARRTRDPVLATASIDPAAR